jgi:hypothetical protein
MPVNDFLCEASGISDSKGALAGCVISQNDALVLLLASNLRGGDSV